MIRTVTSKIQDTVEAVGVAAAGIIGVQNGDVLASAVDQGNKVAESAANAPDWVEPLLQGIIAVVTIIIQFFRNRPARKK